MYKNICYVLNERVCVLPYTCTLCTLIRMYTAYIGKTHMALAIGYECGLDFHVIKGPELLDKYIGASEKAIRSLFTRAMQSGTGLTLF